MKSNTERALWFVYCLKPFNRSGNYNKEQLKRVYFEYFKFVTWKTFCSWVKLTVDGGYAYYMFNGTFQLKGGGNIRGTANSITKAIRHEHLLKDKQYLRKILLNDKLQSEAVVIKSGNLQNRKDVYYKRTELTAGLIEYENSSQDVTLSARQASVLLGKNRDKPQFGFNTLNHFRKCRRYKLNPNVLTQNNKTKDKSKKKGYCFIKGRMYEKLSNEYEPDYTMFLTAKKKSQLKSGKTDEVLARERFFEVMYDM